MHEVQAAAVHLDTDAFSRCKAIIFRIAAQEPHRQQIVWLSALLHDCIASAILHIHAVKAGFVHFVILGKRAVCVKESMVSGNQDIRSAKFIHDNTDKVLQFRNCLIAGSEYSSIGSMAGFINRIVIDINHIHAFYQSASLGSFHGNNIVIF